jgi:hypothetical protein
VIEPDDNRGGPLPTATITFHLPREQEDLESAIMGATAMRTIAQLREYMSREAADSTHASFYRQGISACLQKLDALMEEQPAKNEAPHDAERPDHSDDADHPF